MKQYSTSVVNNESWTPLYQKSYRLKARAGALSATLSSLSDLKTVD
jgi:hypothetical protein